MAFDQTLPANKIDSPIESILYCEFHPKTGPIIVHQTPPEYVTKEQFDSMSNYLIPKPELERRLQTVTALGLKIIGYPIGIDDVKYARNRLIFNVCFVCRPHLRTFHYEPMVKKLNNYFQDLEQECRFLSDPEQRDKIPSILEEIRVKLNEFKVCKLEMTTSITINLKVVNVHPDPEEVRDEQVPLLLITQKLLRPSRWDLTTQQIIPYIDGYRHISRIATEADVEVSLVKACIQNMIYYGIVKLIPIFQYSNSYLPTQRLVELHENEPLRQECLEFVRKSAHPAGILPTFRSIFRLYCSMNYGITVRDLCLQHNPHNLNIDEKKLIRFGLMKGLIRRIHRYPVLINEEEGKESISSGTMTTNAASPWSPVESSSGNGDTSNQSLAQNKQQSASGFNPFNYSSQTNSVISKLNASLFDGDHNYDQICCKVAIQNLSLKDLNEDVDRRDDILVIHK